MPSTLKDQKNAAADKQKIAPSQINGVDATGRCNPAATVTRAEFCQMMFNAGLPDSTMDGKYTNFTCSFERNGTIYDYDKGTISCGYLNSVTKN